MRLWLLGSLLLISAFLAQGSPASRKLRKRKLVAANLDSSEGFEPSFQGPLIVPQAQERSFSPVSEEKQDNEASSSEEDTTDEPKAEVSKGFLAQKSEMAEAFGNLIYDKYLKKYYKVLKEALKSNAEESLKRGAREEGSIGKLLLDVVRVMVSDVIGMTLENYMGYQTERTDSSGSFFDIFVNAVKKQTASKKMGCPL